MTVCIMTVRALRDTERLGNLPKNTELVMAGPGLHPRCCQTVEQQGLCLPYLLLFRTCSQFNWGVMGTERLTRKRNVLFHNVGLHNYKCSYSWVSVLLTCHEKSLGASSSDSTSFQKEHGIQFSYSFA